MDVIERIKTGYAEINVRLKWEQVLQYGAAALGAYTVYNFAVKPFLSPLRKVDIQSIC